MDSKFDICTRAALLVGCQPIASFDDGTVESLVCSEVYDARVRELLAEHDWRFAPAQIQLTHRADAPEARWTDRWQLPPDYERLLALFLGDEPIRQFQIYGDTVCCNVTKDNILVLEYIRQVSEAWFPPWFAVVLEERIASDLAGGVREDPNMADFHRRQSNGKLLTAKRLDRISNPPQKVPSRRLVRARY